MVRLVHQPHETACTFVTLPAFPFMTGFNINNATDFKLLICFITYTIIIHNMYSVLLINLEL